jgi:hypothetical protein
MTAFLLSLRCSVTLALLRLPLGVVGMQLQPTLSHDPLCHYTNTTQNPFVKKARVNCIIAAKLAMRIARVRWSTAGRRLGSSGVMQVFVYILFRKGIPLGI